MFAPWASSRATTAALPPAEATMRAVLSFCGVGETYYNRAVMDSMFAHMSEYNNYSTSRISALQSGC